MKNLLANWKTTGAAVLLVILQVLAVAMPQTFTPELTLKITGIATILGFAFSKDGNVTGGTVKQ